MITSAADGVRSGLSTSISIVLSPVVKSVLWVMLKEETRGEGMVIESAKGKHNVESKNTKVRDLDVVILKYFVVIPLLSTAFTFLTTKFIDTVSVQHKYGWVGRQVRAISEIYINGPQLLLMAVEAARVRQ